MKKQILACMIIASFGGVHAQSTTATNNQNGGQTRFIGFNNNFPLLTKTNGITRTTLNGNTTSPNPNGLGGTINTTGFFGLNTTTPATRFHISGNNNVPLGGYRTWMRDGLMISNNSDNMYIGLWHPNPGNPNETDAIINWGDDDANAQGPDNLRFIFTSYPASGLPSAGQNGLETMRMTYEGYVGVGDFATLNLTPTHTLDVNGEVRIRTTPVAANPQSLIIGQQVGGANDRELQRLDFTGNPNEVLLGNGTWGPATSNVTGNNGIFINNGIVQLGAPCNDIFPLLATRFTESRAVFLNDNSFWMFSGANQNGGVGLGAQPASAGLCGVGNTVEISANNQGPYGNTNASGLRLTKLTSASPTIANGTNGVNNTKLLSVDQNGDVVLVESNTNAPGIGNFCPDPQNPLTDNFEIPMDGFNYNFTNPALTNSSVFMGAPNCLAAQTRLGVFNDIHTTAGYFETDVNVNTTSLGIVSRVTNATGNATGITSRVDGNSALAIGVNSNSTAPGSVENIGFNANVANATMRSFGVNADIDGSSSPLNYGYQTEIINGTNAGATNFGVHSVISTPGAENFGGFFSAEGGTNNFGIFAEALPASTNPSIQGPNIAAFFDGDTFLSGNEYGPSDINIKQNIDTLQNTLDLINNLNAVQFEFMDLSQSNGIHLPAGDHLGFIAQEVEQVLPNLVTEINHPDQLDSLGNVIAPGMTYKGLNYEQLIPVAIQGVKELNQKVDSLNNNQIDSLVQAVDSLTNTVSTQQNQIANLENENTAQQNQIDELEDRLDQLENCLGNLLPVLCQINSSAINQTDEETQQQLTQTLNLELSDGDNVVLEQNVPNPFREQTVINYYIPESVGSASIMFYTRSGQLIKQQEIDTRGNGRINVYGSDLSSGMYTYSLIVDGKVVATKKMVKTH